MNHAKITLEKTSVISKIDDRLFGSFIEHLGRAVYGGIYQPGHPSADESGFRTDVIALVKELNVPIVRYPGGNFVSGYKWEDGVGPKAQRPKRLELAWFALEDNAVGLNEFADWAKAANTEVMMAINLGTRGMQEAMDLVEYCNHPSGTYWSDLRISHGYAAPHKIKTWCLGNEMDGPWQIGYKKPMEYARLANETAKVMRWVDKDIELVACGSSGKGMSTFGTWEDTVLTECYDNVDFLSLHSYYSNADGDTQSFLSRGLDMDAFIRQVAAIARGVKGRLGKKKDIYLSFDEWNVWYHDWFKPEKDRWVHGKHLCEDIYTVEDAVLVGGLLITLLQNADTVKMACLAQLVNVIGAIMTEPDGGAWRQTIFYPFLHASLYGRGTALSCTISAPQYSCAAFTDVPSIDAVAVRDDEAGTLTIFAVNRNISEDITVSIDVRDFGAVTPIEHIGFHNSDLKAVNSADAGHNSTPQTYALRINNGTAEVTMPHASWNVLRFQL